MRLQFDVNDEEAFAAACDRLVAGFEAGAGSADDGWVAHQLLNFKFGYLDGDLSRWSAADLAEILLELFPRKVLVRAEDLAGVVPAVRRFLDYLAREGLLAAGGHPLPRLHAALDEIDGAFRAAMTDTSRHGMAKSLFGGMLDAGMDPEDPDAVQDWVAAHNELPYEERVAATGGPSLEALPLPPLAAPDPAELAAAARDSRLLTWAGGFVAYVGDGRALTQKGNLTLADGRQLVDELDTGDRVDGKIGDRVYRTKSTTELRELDFVFRWCRAAGFVKVRKGRVEPTRAAGLLASDPVTAWHRGFDGLLKLGAAEQRWAGGRYFVPPWTADIDRNVAGLLIAAYAVREGVPVDALSDTMWDQIRAEWAVDDLEERAYQQWRESADDDVRYVLHRFEQLGALQVTGVVEEPTPYGDTEARGGVVTLTPLGLTAVQRLAQQEGLVAPLAGQYRDADAATLLAALAELPDAVIDAEAAVWLTGRDPAAAAAEVAGALAGGGVNPQVVGVGLAVLDVIGPAAEDAVRGLAEDPALLPYAAVWLQTHDLPAPPVDAGILLTGLAVVDPDAAVGLLESLDSAAAQIDVLEQVRVARRPGAEELFQAVAAGHGDKAVAKAARRALFRLRSAATRA